MTPAPGGIPADVLQFIEEHIDTVPQLETLLMMSEAEDRDWPVFEVAARNYVAEERAREILEALHRRGLVSPGSTPDSFRFSAATSQRRALIDSVARSYRANLSRVATFIHSKPSASIKEFARAFTFKKDH